MSDIFLWLLQNATCFPGSPDMARCRHFPFHHFPTGWLTRWFPEDNDLHRNPQHELVPAVPLRKGETYEPCRSPLKAWGFHQLRTRESSQEMFHMFLHALSGVPFKKRCPRFTGWWFGTFFIFPYIDYNHPNWLIFFRGFETTNQFTNAIVPFGTYHEI